MSHGGRRCRLARLLAATAMCVVHAGCDLSDAPPIESKVVQGGDAARGRAIVASGVHGCTACHAVPGIRAPRGVVGPPLHGTARRGLIAGRLPNTPAVLVAFLENPPLLAPETGMPNVGLTPEEARHVAAYLYTLERLPDAR
jgi:cytochrome c2